MLDDPDFLAFAATIAVMTVIGLLLWLMLRIAGPGPLDGENRARRDPTLGFRDPWR